MQVSSNHLATLSLAHMLRRWIFSPRFLAVVVCLIYALMGYQYASMYRSIQSELTPRLERTDAALSDEALLAAELAEEEIANARRRLAQIRNEAAIEILDTSIGEQIGAIARANNVAVLALELHPPMAEKSENHEYIVHRFNVRTKGDAAHLVDLVNDLEAAFAKKGLVESVEIRPGPYDSTEGATILAFRSLIAPEES